MQNVKLTTQVIFAGFLLNISLLEVINCLDLFWRLSTICCSKSFKINNQFNAYGIIKLLTCHSYITTAMPPPAADPATPTSMGAPMLVANNDNPT